MNPKGLKKRFITEKIVSLGIVFLLVLCIIGGKQSYDQRKGKVKMQTITKKTVIGYGVIAALVVVFDLLSKAMVVSHMHLYQSIMLIPHFFLLTYIQNRGAAWGIMQGRLGLFSLIGIAAGIAMVYYFFKSQKEQVLLRLGLALAFGGMLGNLYDRLILGYVRDFLNFYIFGYDFPVFNVADMGVTIGMALIILQFVIEEYKVWTLKKSMPK